MRAPVHAPFATQDAAGPSTLGGRMMIRGGHDADPKAAARSAVQAITNHTAGHAQALSDRAAVAGVVARHALLRGGAAVAHQPHALEALAQIREHGQTALEAPGMVAAYNLHVSPPIAEAADRITVHTLQQAQVEQAEVAGQELLAAQESAASEWRAPAQFVQRLAAVHALAMDQLPPDTDTIDRLAAAHIAVGRAVGVAMDKAIAAKETEFATHILSGWGNTLTPAAYQLAIARLEQAAMADRIAAIFADAAGGNPAPDSAQAGPADGASDMLMIAAPTGAAVHPIAGGVVDALSGPTDNMSVHIRHPDGSGLCYGGIGLAAVRAGDLVTPSSVIGSARPTITLAATKVSTKASETAALVHSAGGISVLISGIETPRTWDMQAMTDRIRQQGGVTTDECALAISHALRRMNADQAAQAAGDLAAGREAIITVAAEPDRYARATDLSREIAAQFTPGGLARIDDALHRLTLLATPPVPDNPDALRLELLQRQFPQAFVTIDLVPLIGIIHPADLAQLATSQASLASGEDVRNHNDRRSAILDAMARFEIVGCCGLPDLDLPAIMVRADTLVRVNQTDPADRLAIDSRVAAAIQHLMVCP